jgi:hypothetical protein
MELFFTTYQNDILQGTFNPDPAFKDPKFRKFVITQKGKTVETVKLFRDSMASTLKKPQQCLYSDTDFYIAVDTYTDTHYICYRNLLMVDIDIPKESDLDGMAVKDVESLKIMLSDYNNRNPDSLIDVYQTRSGFHLFLLHRTFDYQTDEAVSTMLELHSDFYYTIYSHLRGWSVRLNRKIQDVDRRDQYIYKKVGRFGSGVANPHLEKLVNLHLNLLESFQDSPDCRMR